VFFTSCKLVLNNRNEYLQFINHYIDILHGNGTFVSSITNYPIYVFIEDDQDLTLSWTYKKSEYSRRKYREISVNTFISFMYIISDHFIKRFNERFESVSNTRLRTLVKKMLKGGTYLKRKDSFQLMKYKQSSLYVLYSRFENNNKVHYLIVISNINILVTIYRFDNIKDLKYFKEI